MTKAEIIARYEAFSEREAQNARDCDALLERMRAAAREQAAIMEAVIENHHHALAMSAESQLMLKVLRDLHDELQDDPADWWKG